MENIFYAAMVIMPGLIIYNVIMWYRERGDRREGAKLAQELNRHHDEKQGSDFTI